VSVRYCESCGAVLERKVYKSGYREVRAVFLRRRFCTQRCGSTRRASQRGAKQRKGARPAIRTCELPTCGAMFSRRRSPKGRLEDLKKFEQRRFCSSKCSNIARRSTRAFVPHCFFCGEEIPRDWRQESWINWAQRLFCNVPHRIAYYDAPVGSRKTQNQLATIKRQRVASLRRGQQPRHSPGRQPAAVQAVKPRANHPWKLANEASYAEHLRRQERRNSK
jgi:hypothetical protein